MKTDVRRLLKRIVAGSLVVVTCFSQYPERIYATEEVGATEEIMSTDLSDDGESSSAAQEEIQGEIQGETQEEIQEETQKETQEGIQEETQEDTQQEIQADTEQTGDTDESAVSEEEAVEPEMADILRLGEEGTEATIEAGPVTVTGPNGEYGDFASLQDALTQLDSVSAKAKGTYTISISQNQELSSNITLPAYITELRWESDEPDGEALDVAIDMMGYNMTYGGKMVICGDIHFLSSEKESVLTLSQNTAATVLELQLEGRTAQSADGQHLFSNVNVKATKGEVRLQGNHDSVYMLDSVAAGTLICEGGKWEIPSLNATKFNMKTGSVLEVGTFTQASSGKTNLEAGSTLIVSAGAAFYGMNISAASTGSETEATLVCVNHANIVTNGKWSRDNEALHLAICQTDSVTHTSYLPLDYTCQTLLCTTNLSSFPVEYIVVRQSGEESASLYNQIYQQNKNIYVGRDWITVWARGENIASFVKWSDAAGYLTTLSNSAMSYEVEFADDINLDGEITMPQKAQKVTFRGAGGIDGKQKITLTYSGNIKLLTNMNFENIDFVATKGGALNLNGKTLTLTDSTISFTGVSGTGASSLAMSNAQMDVSGNVQIGKDLSMKNSRLDAAGKITLANLISLDDCNHISYGGNSANNILTITGTVSTCEEYDGNTWIALNQGGTASVKRAAVDIQVKAIENSEAGYRTDDLIMNAAAVSSTWFVVGSQYGEQRVSVGGTLYKSGKTIRYGAKTDSAVQLLSRKYGETGSFVSESEFATLQEALTEIDQLGQSNHEYQIILNSDLNGSVTKETKDLSLPSKLKGLTISSADASPKTIYYAKTLTLKSNLTLQNILLSPKSAGAISLGNNVLQMENASGIAEGRSITSVTGGNVAGTSGLYLDNVDWTINGKVDKVGRLQLDNGAKLTITGAASVGNIYNASGDGTICEIATVSRKNGVVTAVTPGLTVASSIRSAGDGLILEALDKSTMQPIDFSGSDMEQLRAAGIKLVKATKVSDVEIVPAAENVGTLKGTLIKLGGYITYIEGTADGVVGAEVVYSDGDGQEVRIPCRTFADAVTEINNLATRRAYTIVVNEKATSENKIAALTMPSAKAVSELTIEGVGEEPVTLWYKGGMSLTSNTVWKNVAFSQAITTDYPAIVKIAAGSYALTIDGEVVFNTPLALDGGKKGSLVWTEDGQIFTLTNGLEQSDLDAFKATESLILGSITSFANVTIPTGNIVTVREYATLSKGKPKYSAAGFVATNLYDCGELRLEGINSVAGITITNLYLEDGKLCSDGKLSVANAYLNSKGTGGFDEIRAVKEFTFSGRVNVTADDVRLYTRQKTAKDNTPYLTFSGDVTVVNNGNPIDIGVSVPDVTQASQMHGMLATLSGAPKASAILVNAKKAPATVFAPMNDNVSEFAYTSENTDGYVLMKSGNGIYVYYGASVAIAVCRGDATDGDLDGADVLGYYSNWSDAVKAIDALKDKKSAYTMLLLQDVGTETAPVAVSFPSYASEIYVASVQERKATVYYTKALSLKTRTTLHNLTLAPVARNSSTRLYDPSSLGISTGSVDLVVSGNVDLWETAAIKEITSKGKNRLSVQQTNLEVSGAVSGFDRIELQQGATLKAGGSVKTTTLILNGGSCLDGSVNSGSTVTITNLESNGASANQIRYTKGLSLAGTVTGNNIYPVELDLVAAGKNVDDYVIGYVNANNKPRITLSDSKKLATLTKAPTEAFSFSVNGTSVSGSNCPVKANKAVYVVEKSVYQVKMTRTDGKDVSPFTSYYLDYSQAISEISNWNDGTARYEIEMDPYGTLSTVDDINLTDKAACSAMTAPTDNKAAGVVIAGQAGGSSVTVAAGTVNLFGDCTFREIHLSSGGNLTLVGKKNSNKKSYTGTSITVADSEIIVNSATIPQLYLSASASCHSYLETHGASSITNVEISGDGDAYVAGVNVVKNKNTQPAVTIGGQVVCKDGYHALPIKIIEKSGSTYSEITNYMSDGVYLAMAAKAPSDKIVAYTYKDSADENVLSYKSRNNYVTMGWRSDLQIGIKNLQNNSLTYAKSYSEAIAIINSFADAKAEYELIVLGDSAHINVGTFSTPSKAAGITLRSESTEPENKATVQYSGSLKLSCSVDFENVNLVESGKESITVDMGKNPFAITFDSNTTVNEHEIIITKWTGANGTLGLRDSDIQIDGNFSAASIGVSGNTSVHAGGKFAVNHILGQGTEDIFRLYANLSAASTAVKGKIDGAQLQLVTQQKGDGEMALIALPCAGTENITYMTPRTGDTDLEEIAGTLYKRASNLYWTPETDHVTNLLVSGRDAEGNLVYQAGFVEWDQAVKEIDKRSDTKISYRVELLQNLGNPQEGEIPVASVSFPAKCKEVTVCSREGESFGIFFTATKLTLKADTCFDNIGLFAVKKQTLNKTSVYKQNAFSIDAGKFALSQREIKSCASNGGADDYVLNCTQISGKGIYSFVAGDGINTTTAPASKLASFAEVELWNHVKDDMYNENQEISECIVANGISGVGKLCVNPGLKVESQGDISVKNMQIFGSEVKARNISVSAETSLESASLIAGTEKIGDGKIVLKNVIVWDGDCYIQAKQDKNGNTLMEVSGTIQNPSHEPVTVSLRYNNNSAYVKLYDGIVIIKGRKVSPDSYIPDYLHMGDKTNGGLV